MMSLFVVVFWVYAKMVTIKKKRKKNKKRKKQFSYWFFYKI